MRYYFILSVSCFRSLKAETVRELFQTFAVGGERCGYNYRSDQNCIGERWSGRQEFGWDWNRWSQHANWTSIWGLRSPKGIATGFGSYSMHMSFTAPGSQRSMCSTSTAFGKLDSRNVQLVQKQQQETTKVQRRKLWFVQTLSSVGASTQSFSCISKQLAVSRRRY